MNVCIATAYFLYSTKKMHIKKDQILDERLNFNRNTIKIVGEAPECGIFSRHWFQSGTEAVQGTLAGRVEH